MPLCLPKFRRLRSALTLPRLLSKTPPQDPSRLRLLFDVYFERIHPLRCLGFIHKPLFLQALDRGTLLEEYGESLVWIVAACGARQARDCAPCRDAPLMPLAELTVRTTRRTTLSQPGPPRPASLGLSRRGNPRWQSSTVRP